eukprot:g6593.t1
MYEFNFHIFFQAQVNELTAARDVLRQDVEGQQAKTQRAEQALEAARARAIQAGVDLAPETPAAVDIQDALQTF